MPDGDYPGFFESKSTKQGSIKTNPRAQFMISKKSAGYVSIDFFKNGIPCSSEFLSYPLIFIRYTRRNHKFSSKYWRQRNCNGKIMLPTPLKSINQLLEAECGIIKRNLAPEISLVCYAQLFIPFCRTNEFFSLERIKCAHSKTDIR